MELRQLAYFVTVAEELHFGRAAERLHIVQSAVSQQIRRLEKELGRDLFDRSPRHVRLTGAGERLLPEARAVLAAAERARAVVTGRTALRVGTSTGLGAHLDRVLAAYATLRPDIGVELLSAPSRQRLEQVREGRLDATFLRTGADGPDLAPGLRAAPVWQEPLLAALPARHPLAAAPDVAVADLAALPLGLTERRNHPALVDLVVGACHDAGFEPCPGPTCGTLQDTLATIGAGATPVWTVVYASHASTLNTSRVAFVPFRAPGLSLTTTLVTRAGEGEPDDALAAFRKACLTGNDLDR
ncbi:LysR family transcriptional regulator [Streptomyces sp. SID8379]|uniref:LysR substrate-binding domain-containing protein n=1 Tax=unclassified Streptomyces TaxID=2593676 RepID=UPI00035CD7EC|nr:MULTISPECIES: LysR family transcriptional regulator [unclassified Streptomyces]MYW66671.1 LysR family transcriptional regulator [Streptomyces sp. SID8379]